MQQWEFWLLMLSVWLQYQLTNMDNWRGIIASCFTGYCIAKLVLAS